MRVLVTGGLGYIGSHTCVALSEAGHVPIVVDNLANSKQSVLQRVKGLASGEIGFHRADVRERGAIERIVREHPVEAVLHFAGSKSVNESVEKPLLYYENNLGGSMALIEVMLARGVKNIVFSSSATVYGEPERLPIDEAHPLRPSNPYGKTKLMVEHLLADVAYAQPGFRYAALRYFNPIGAHHSGSIGEDPRGIPNNLMPFVAQVAVGKHPRLRVFGNDYPTGDGTGVRDYIHVMDLARGHVAALDFLTRKQTSITANLGTGSGYSVLEAVKAFEDASGRKVALEIVERRPGDVAACYADASLAASQLGWKAKLGIEAMCRDLWRWQSENPDGYPD